jgi:hypothetical protein
VGVAQLSPVVKRKSDIHDWWWTAKQWILIQEDNAVKWGCVVLFYFLRQGSHCDDQTEAILPQPPQYVKWLNRVSLYLDSGQVMKPLSWLYMGMINPALQICCRDFKRECTQSELNKCCGGVNCITHKTTISQIFHRKDMKVMPTKW